MMENTQEYIEKRALFDEYYHKEIFPRMQELENKRKKYFNCFMFASIFTLSWSIALFCGVLDKFIEMLEAKGVNVELLSCLLVLFICLPMVGFKRQAKESLLPLISNFFGNFEYKYKSGIDESVVADSKIISYYDYLEFDDGFVGFYEGVNVSIDEYIAYKEIQVTRNNETKYELKKDKRGIIFCATMNKKFKGQTVVSKDRGILNKITKYKKLERVTLEAPVFEKYYEVYSDNQIEARYILTPVMLKYMEELKLYFSKIEFSFFDDIVFVNILTKRNMFECNSFFTSIINKKRIYKNFNELYLLFSIIHTMHLNEERLL